MHHHIADIDQHPVTRREPFDARLTVACVFQRAQHVIGKRPHMAMRAARSDNQRIGDRAFAAQVYADEILRLVVLKPVENQVFNAKTFLNGRTGTLVCIGRRRFGGG